MPSKENCETLISPPSGAEVISLGVDNLITEIKENLRLKSNSNLKSTKSLSLKRRSSPYSLPSRNSSSSCECCSSPKCHKHSTAQKLDLKPTDPFEMLQELLKEGTLVKEAVRRLELGLSPKRRIFYDDSFSFSFF